MSARNYLWLNFDQAQAELFGDHLLDGFDGDLAGLRVDEFFRTCWA